MNTVNQIYFNKELRRFIITQVEDANKNIGVKLDDDGVNDGFLVLNDEQDAIAEKCFDAIQFIIDNQFKNSAPNKIIYSIYSKKEVDEQGQYVSGDNLTVENVERKLVDTGNAQVYAMGLETDTPEIKAKKLQAILDLTAFKRMCVEIINR